MRLAPIVGHCMLTILLMLPIAMIAGAPSGFYFFSKTDIATIKRSAATGWGGKIMETLRSKVKDRERHLLHVPETAGGYAHNYFCQIHNVQLVFEWESPYAHFCPVCGKRWEGNEKFDAAWIAAAHDRNLDYLTATMYLLMATDSTVYAERIKTMLLDYARYYPGYVEHNRERIVADKYSGRMYSQSLDEAVWAIMGARVYLASKPFMRADEQKMLERNYLRPCASMLMRKQNKGNWQAWHNGAISALGVALEDDSIINVAINDPAYGYHAVMRENVYADGWWNEGSATYHFYPLKGILLTAEALRCRGIDLYDRQLVKMFLSPVQLMYSDLTFPSLNDGWYGTSLLDYAPLYEIMACRAADDSFKDLLNVMYTKRKRSSPEALLNGITPIDTKSSLTLSSTCFPDLGVGVLRRGDKTVILKYGPDGGVHGHPDKLTLCIHDGATELFPDLGATAYSLPVCRDWYQTTIAHNTITLDQHNQKKTTGALLKFAPSKKGGTIKAVTTDAYPGVEIRRTLKLRKDKLEDHVVIVADSSHVYDYALMSITPLHLQGATDTMLLAYPRIEAMQCLPRKRSYEFKGKDFFMKIKVFSAGVVEFYSGEAPGTPPKNGQKEVNKIYPFLVRSSGRKMAIVTTWTFGKKSE